MPFWTYLAVPGDNRDILILRKTSLHWRTSGSSWDSRLLWGERSQSQGNWGLQRFETLILVSAWKSLWQPGWRDRFARVCLTMGVSYGWAWAGRWNLKKLISITCRSQIFLLKRFKGARRLLRWSVIYDLFNLRNIKRWYKSQTFPRGTCEEYVQIHPAGSYGIKISHIGNQIGGEGDEVIPVLKFIFLDKNLREFTGQVRLTGRSSFPCCMTLNNQRRHFGSFVETGIVQGDVIGFGGGDTCWRHGGGESVICYSAYRVWILPVEGSFHVFTSKIKLMMISNTIVLALEL